MKAKASGLAIGKKLKKEDRVEAWNKMPAVQIPPIPDTLVKETRFEDVNATAQSIYFVTAQDAAGRESRWFPTEPAPTPGAPGTTSSSTQR